MKPLIILLLTLTIFSCQEKAEKLYSKIRYPKTEQRIQINSKMDSLLISDLSKNDLRLLRNEIFARHGYIFNTKELSEYFSQYDWYKPAFDASNIENKLTETDRFNITLIRSIEEKLKIPSVNKVITLQDYLDLIPEIKLPYHFTCDEGFDAPKLNYENEIIKKYKPEGATIIGKLYHGK